MKSGQQFKIRMLNFYIVLKKRKTNIEKTLFFTKHEEPCAIGNMNFEYNVAVKVQHYRSWMLKRKWMNGGGNPWIFQGY